MKCARLVSVLLALSALPLVAAAAQGTVGNANAAANRCKNTPQAGQNGNSQAGAAAVAVAQANKCPAPVAPPAVVPPPAPPPPPPPPPASSPPTGVNRAKGVVFEDWDGNGAQDIYGGEMGLAGWQVSVYWNGQVVASTTTDANGNYDLGGLGNSGYEVCVSMQAGYTQSPPPPGMSYNGCGGAGYAFSFNSAFEAWAVNNFGMILQ
jgi:SdrD B-like domain